MPEQANIQSFNVNRNKYYHYHRKFCEEHIYSNISKFNFTGNRNINIATTVVTFMKKIYAIISAIGQNSVLMEIGTQILPQP